MNSKEALARLTYCDNDMESEEKYYKIIKQDLDRLEKLEKAHEKLKERYKHRAETSHDLCKAVKQYEKAFDILLPQAHDIHPVPASHPASDCRWKSVSNKKLHIP